MRRYNHDVEKARDAIEAADENHWFTLKTVKHAKLERILTAWLYQLHMRLPSSGSLNESLHSR